MEHLEDKKRKAVARAFFKGSAAIVMEIWLKFFLDDEKKNYYQTKQKKRLLLGCCSSSPSPTKEK